MAKIKDTQALTNDTGAPINQNAGFQYEIDLIKRLRDQGFRTGDPAGADNAKADLELYLPSQTSPIKFELKEKLSADFAQLNMDFDTTSKQFYIDKTKSSNTKEAAMTMIGIAEEFNIIGKTNDQWKPKETPPAKFTLPPTAGLQQRKDAYQLDLARFKDFFLAKGGSLAAEQVEKYYNSKSTYYIQIKGKGLYYLGSDPMNFGVPRFSSMVGDSSIRIRIKANSKSQARYSFLMALKIGRLRASSYDLDRDPSFLIK